MAQRYFLQLPNICKKCGAQKVEYPLGGGVCGNCLVKNFTMEEALKACSRAHLKIMFLYQRQEATTAKRGF